MTIVDCFREKLALLGLSEPRPTVAVLRLDGVIGQIGALRRGLTIAGLAGLIEKAFAQKRLSALALVINSPGGAAAQSALIHQRLRALAEEKSIPVLAFCEDVAASGGYMLALAADEIYAHPMSLVGSIGVISSGFGFAGAIERLGIERRVYTAGENKSRLDPFLAEKPEDIQRVKDLQLDIHQGFKDMVTARRQSRLKAGPEVLFTGDVWTGRQALELGLIDGLGDLRSTLRARFGTKVRLLPITRPKSFLPWRNGLGTSAEGFAAGNGGAGGIGAGLAEGLIATAEERALWSRFGL